MLQLIYREGECKMRVETALLDDMMEIYDLTNELEGVVLPLDRFCRIYEATMRSKDDFIFVAREEKILGYVHGRFTQELHHGGKIATLQEMIVRKENRNHHIGKMLLMEAILFASGKGAIEVELTSHLSRKPAHSFYEACGFQRTSWKFVRVLSENEIL